MSGIETIKALWDGMDWSKLLGLFSSVIPALLCITLHELSHGYVAYRLGDNTAKNAGRLTLNPLRHIDIFGLLMMVVLKFGWAKPVPVNMYHFKNPRRGMAVTALAGPVCNLLLAMLLLFLYGLIFRPLTAAGTGLADSLLEMTATAAYLSTALAVFNIVPIPPLDGSKVLFSLLPDGAYEKLMRFERYGMLILMLLVATGVLGSPLSAATGWIFDRLFVIARWGNALTVKLFV